jgi:hypothetical protein
MAGRPDYLQEKPIFCKKKKKYPKQSQSLKNMYTKAQFENPKHLHQTTFENLKYLQQTMF